MLTADDDRLVEVLDDATCLQRLGSGGTGRLGFTDGALPAILPVPFGIQDGHVMIPARRGSAIVSAVRGSVVVFEVGSYDAAARTGWSITAVGPTRLVIRSEEVAALQLRFSWQPSAADRCYIAVVLGLLRGWQMSERPAAAPGVGGSDGTATW